MIFYVTQSVFAHTILPVSKQSGKDWCDRMWDSIGKRLWLIISVVTALVGIGGWQDDTRVWIGWFANMNPTLSGFLMGAGATGIAVFILVKLESLARRKGWIESERPPKPEIDWITANAIIDNYLQFEKVRTTSHIWLSIRNDILKKFENSPGSMMGAAVYNRDRLRLWIESNAARLLVRHRGELQ